MPKFEARFWLTHAQPNDHCEYQVNETGSYGVRVPAVKVTFAGHKGEPFGSATPEARCEMLIVGQELALSLLEDYVGFLCSQGPQPIYRVTFERIDEPEA